MEAGIFGKLIYFSTHNREAGSIKSVMKLVALSMEAVYPSNGVRLIISHGKCLEMQIGV